MKSYLFALVFSGVAVAGVIPSGAQYCKVLVTNSDGEFYSAGVYCDGQGIRTATLTGKQALRDGIALMKSNHYKMLNCSWDSGSSRDPYTYETCYFVTE